MSTPPDKKYTFDYSVEQVISFSKKLTELGITINKDSDLYRIGFYVLELLEKHKDPNLRDEWEDFRPVMRDVIGFNNFLSKIIPLLDSEYNETVIEHIKLLNTSSIPLTKMSKVTDQGANKLFELYVAGLCYPDFTAIELDSPINSKGNNPDVIFQYNEEKWGIACKMINSFKAKSIMDNIIKGIDQIENSPCDCGFVMINLKNVIDYDEIWPLNNNEKYLKGEEPPMYGTFLDFNVPARILNSYVFKMQELINEEYSIQEQRDLFKNKKAYPLAVSLFQGATGVIKDGSPIFTFIGFLSYNRFNIFPDKVLEVYNKIYKNIR